MPQQVATFISWIFHPLLMPLLACWLLFQSVSNLQYLNPEWQYKILLFIALGTFLIPVSFLPFLYYRKWIQSIELVKGHERFLPLFLSSIMYFVTYHYTQNLPLPALLQLVLLGATLTVFLLMLISIFYKISLHAAGIGGIIGILLALGLRMGIDISLYLIFSVLTAGLIGFARLSLHAHRPSELYSGYLAGFLVNYLLFMFAR